LYLGVASGGIAYTLQAIAQQHTSPADSSIIMGGGETLFGAIGGAWLLHEMMNVSGYLGCAAIMGSIVLVELVPYLQKKSR
jgi:drug/metabolite transporter (DMT)-like permease